MKKSVVLCLLLFISGTTAYSQSGNAVIAADAVSIVYFGLQNPISVAVPGHNLDQLVVETNMGSLTLENGQYYLSVPYSKEETNTVRITVFIKIGDEKILAGYKDFKVLRVPSPTPAFGKFTSGEVKVDMLSSIDSVHIVMECFFYEGLHYEVNKFQLVLQPKEGPAEAFSSVSCSLTKQMKNSLQKTGPGTMIIVANIWASAPGIGSKQIPGSIVLTVVE